MQNKVKYQNAKSKMTEQNLKIDRIIPGTLILIFDFLISILVVI
jgi:hypothetical protein